MAERIHPATVAKAPDDVVYPEMIPFVLLHVAALGAIWTGITARDVVRFLSLFWLRMFGITAGYHRYFAHRSYKTSRVFQFILALLGAFSIQMGALWWASKHRDHHKYSDTPEDSHSPAQFGFWFAHVGWIWSRSKWPCSYDRISDFTKYPELRWLDKHYAIPGILLGFAVWAIWGWSAFWFGFCASTVLTWHTTFAINSVAHVLGKQDYVTSDDSRNSWYLALATLGEGWHNNHHYFQSSVRQGFRWWQIDVSFYVLWLLSKVGIVWDLKMPPKEVVEGNRRVTDRAIDYSAERLIQSLGLAPRMQQMRSQFDAAKAEMLRELTETMKQRWEQAPSLAEWKAAMERTFTESDLKRQIDELPSIEELRDRAQAMFRRASQVSCDELAVRAYTALLESLTVEPPLAAA